MSPSQTLQTVSETTSNLYLQRLEQVFEAHFQQQNAHDLCNIMSAIIQFLEETVYYFVLRCLEKRLKILLFSGKPDDTPHFINKSFLRTLGREIKSLFIVPEIKHLPRAGNVCNEDLLAVVMRASTYEHQGQLCNSRLLRNCKRK